MNMSTNVERLDFTKPPPGYTANGPLWSLPREGQELKDYERSFVGPAPKSTVARYAANGNGLAVAWVHYKERHDPPGLSVGCYGGSVFWVHDAAGSPLLGPFACGASGDERRGSEIRARTAAWAWYERRVTLVDRLEVAPCYRIDHCGGCGSEHEPQEKDLCPTCGENGPGLITTWGPAQAERYRTGERYSTTVGERDQEVGPNLWPQILTWSDAQVSAVERWLVDNNVDFPEVLRG